MRGDGNIAPYLRGMMSLFAALHHFAFGKLGVRLTALKETSEFLPRTGKRFARLIRV
jgi:hypothetical protein